MSTVQKKLVVITVICFVNEFDSKYIRLFVIVIYSLIMIYEYDFLDTV